MDRAIVDQLREYLVPYLASHGMKPSSPKFRCFTGEHSDSTPSCHIVPKSKGCAWKCFGCNSGGDIFTAAHYLEGLPLEGADFWKQTIPTLAEHFKIEYDPRALTEADKERYQLLAAFKAAAEYIQVCHDNPDSAIHSYLENRGWSSETAKSLGVGTIDKFEDYRSHMESLGWSRKYLSEKGDLLNGALFNRHCIIFTIKDFNGRPVAFGARDTTKKHGDPMRYINSPLSIIYHKGSILYMLDQCIDQVGSLWVVEGYADAITMWQAGIKKVCAIGGTAFTSPSALHPDGENHIDILTGQGLTDVILCLDSDKMGVLNTKKIIEEHLPKAPTLSMRIHSIPDGTGDPDDYIKEHGIEGFRKILDVTPFEWRLEHIAYDEEPRKIVDDMLPLIIDESNAITRWDMCRVLSTKTNIPLTILNEEVMNRTAGAKHSVEKKIQQISVELQKKMRKVYDPDLITSAIADSHERILEVTESTKTDKVEYTNRITAIRDAMNRNETGERFSCGQFKLFESQLGGGIPSDAQYIACTGIPNIGKTSFLRHLTWELVRVNPDIHVIFMSIDDSFQRIIRGLVSIDTGYSQTIISSNVLLNKYPAYKDQVWKSYERLENLKGSLVVKDVADGATVLAMERHINEALRKYPDKKILFVLDNFHKLSDVDTGEPSVISAASKRIKRMSTKYNIPIIVNVEVRKTDWSHRVTLRDLKGSASIEYDADLALILHQAYHVDRQSHLTWVPENGKHKEPINEIEWSKNKISGFKGSNWYKFNSHISRMSEVSESSIEVLLEKERTRTAANNSNGRPYDNYRSNRGYQNKPGGDSKFVTSE